MGLSRILVADADAEGLRRLVEVVTAAGCRAIEAKDGLQALEAFVRERPDAVIVDATLTGVGGIHVVTEVRRSTPGHWVPVVFTTDEGGQEVVARAIEAGADQVLHKPFGPELLQAHLANFGRVLGLEEELRQRNEGLEEYRRNSEEEEKLAKSMLDGMIGIGEALAGQVRTWVGPAERFSGDIVLAERTPSGAIVAFLGDVTGHGLAAAFGSMPVIRTFTAMARKGFSLGAIASELNSAAYNNLRRDQFIAGTLALFDPDTGMLEVWNGGNPAVLMIDDDCRLQARFRSEHLPLGILRPNDFEARTKSFLVESPCQLTMVSDGVTEQRDASGRRIGELGLLDLLQATAAPARLAMLRARYTDIGVREDDCSVLMLDCRPGPRRMAAPTREMIEIGQGAGHAPDGRDTEWELTLKLSVDTLRRADAVPLVAHLVANLQPPGFEPGRLHVVLAELFNNALDHGLLHLDSRLKDNPDGFQIWMDEREARLGRIAEGSIDVSVASLRSDDGAPRFRVRVSDTGRGFNPAAAGTANGLSHGRGIALVRSLAESLEYRAGGASVEVVCAA